MKKAFIYLIVFLAIQLVAGLVVQGLWTLISGENASANATCIILTTILFSIAVMVVFLLAKWSEVSPNWIRKRPWVTLIWCVLAALGAIIPSVWMQEHMPELPNIAEDAFDMIMKDRWGYVSVGLMAPLAEELVFRGAILRELLRWSSRPWVAIAISALFFAAAHMNPAQIPHAFLIGMLLGWMYYRTDSIIPGVAYHWINNSVAYVMYNLYPSSDITLTDICGSERTVLMAVAFSLCIFLPALFQLNMRLKK
jgi:hypothetical protein